MKEEEKTLEFKASDFHILDYEPDMTRFVDIAVGRRAIVGIDEEGEIWILCGRQNEYGNLNLPKVKEDSN